MKKNLILFLASVVFAIITYGQNTAYNHTAGYIANGYDVVSYFNNNP